MTRLPALLRRGGAEAKRWLSFRRCRSNLPALPARHALGCGTDPRQRAAVAPIAGSVTPFGTSGTGPPGRSHPVESGEALHHAARRWARCRRQWSRRHSRDARGGCSAGSRTGDVCARSVNSTALGRRPSRQLCGFVLATSADEAGNGRYVRRPPVTELPGETTLLEPNSHLQSEGEDGDADRNWERAKEDGPACPHQGVPDVEGISRVPVGAVRDEVVRCERVIGASLSTRQSRSRQCVAWLAADHTMMPAPAASNGIPKRLRTLGLPFQPARRVCAESASGAAMLTVV